MDPEDELDLISNACADLVSLARLEPALRHLFQDRPAGVWVAVRELYERGGVTAEDVPSSLVAAWMPSPHEASEYAVVSFFDDDLKWSLSAVYNVARLLRTPLLAKSAVTV